MVWIAHKARVAAVCGRTDVDLADRHIPDLPLDLTPDIDLVEARVWCGVCIDFAMRFNDYDWDESQSPTSPQGTRPWRSSFCCFATSTKRIIFLIAEPGPSGSSTTLSGPLRRSSRVAEH